MTCNEAKQIPLVSYLASLGINPQKIDKYGYWYSSPFLKREQKTGTFKVDTKLNIFYCYSTKIGGSIIDFVQNYLNVTTVADVLTYLSKKANDNNFSFSPQKEVTSKVSNKETFLQIEKVKQLENKALIQYLENERKIPYSLAKRYVQECYYKTYENQIKPYFALYFGNDKGGAELRAKIFKGSTNPKTITTIKGKDSRKVSIFEGFIDYLSCLVHYNKLYSEFDVIVLNSLSNMSSVNFAAYEKINLYLDNDTAGKQASETLKSQYSNIVDFSFLYQDYKDFNESIVASKTKINPFGR